VNDNREMYAPPEPVPVLSKFCALCSQWTDHFADACTKADVEPVEADPSFVASQLLEARKKLGRTR
jgi:hypothetical protein